MKRNIDTVITDFEGRPVKAGNPRLKLRADGRPLIDEATSDVIVLEPAPDFTMKRAFFTALGSQIEGDDRSSGEDKMKLYAVGNKLAAGGEVDLTTDEAALLKARCAKVFNAMTFGRIADFLDKDPATASEAAA